MVATQYVNRKRDAKLIREVLQAAPPPASRQQSPPQPSPQQQSEGQKPSIPESVPGKSPNETGRRKKKERANDSAQEGDRQNVEAKPSVPVKRLMYSQEVAPSEHEDAPYAVRVVIQTNVTIQPASLAVKCDSEVSYAKPRVLGTSVLQHTGEGYVGDKTTYWFFFAHPGFTPENPVVILLMAKRPIRVLGVREGPPAPR